MKTYTPDELNKILADHGLWLRGEGGGFRADLSGSNLSGSNLSYSNLRGSDLRGSDLSYSNLRGSDLSYSNLRGSDLRGSDLRGSNLSYSNLRGSNLRGSDLRDSNLSGSNLSGSNLSGSNLSGAKITATAELLPGASVHSFGPIGSRNDYILFYRTNEGLFVTCGCFLGTVDLFLEKVREAHGENHHGNNYRDLVSMVQNMEEPK